MSIHFTPNKEIGVELGSYDIADWPRHTYLGPYKTEEEALNATEAKIIEAEKAVEEDTL